jgi:hypothetical protein
MPWHVHATTRAVVAACARSAARSALRRYAASSGSTLLPCPSRRKSTSSEASRLRMLSTALLVNDVINTDLPCAAKQQTHQTTRSTGCSLLTVEEVDRRERTEVAHCWTEGEGRELNWRERACVERKAGERSSHKSHCQGTLRRGGEYHVSSAGVQQGLKLQKGLRTMATSA